MRCAIAVSMRIGKKRSPIVALAAGIKHFSNHYEICPICFWEDDGQDDIEADFVWGGPNGQLSLTQARANFLKFAACEKEMIPNVRKPLPEEL